MVPFREVVLSSVFAVIVSVVLLLAVLAFAVVRPRGWPEAVAAVPAATVVVLVGAVPVSEAWSEVRRLLPVVGFLAAVLALAQLCDDVGLFAAAGASVARVCADRPRRLLAGVFVAAAVTTAVLSLDATVVLLTPVVFATAARVGAAPRPHVFACTHLANTASLLLPVSNLTNLLAFAASGLTFTRFAGLMSVPWLVAIAVEFVVFRRFFRADLAASAQPPTRPPRGRLPLFPVAVVVLTLAGFVLCSVIGESGLGRAGRRGGARHAGAAAEANHGAGGGGRDQPTVLGVRAGARGRREGGPGQWPGPGVRSVLPAGSSLPALLAVAAFSAILANLINNLPAVLALLPIVAVGGPGSVLAVLIGVNIGPNLTYVGSLATLLWRRVLVEHDAEPGLGRFTRLGLLTVPAGLAAATVALWAVLRTTGG